ncbi:MAG: hypothetical protein JSW46_05520, partial [Gemmatimonadota bacterium]
SVSELVINRRNFDETGNSFKLIYDSPRDAARTYEYRYVWSFFGGGGVEEAWRAGSASALSASPPYRLHQVVLDADPQALQAAQVQAVTVKLFCTVGGVERMEQLTLNVSRGQASGNIECLLPADGYDYAYEMTWRLAGNRTVSSGRRSSTDALLRLDDLPSD